MVPSVVKKIFQSISSPLQAVALCVGAGSLKMIHPSPPLEDREESPALEMNNKAFSLMERIRS